MHNNRLNSKIAQFLSIQTNHMGVIRDRIPAGPEFFSFYRNEDELNWYEFWDHIADHRPIGMKLKTHLFEIGFNEHKLDWEVLNSDHPDQENLEIILENLRAFEVRAKTIRNWIRWNADSTEI